jgi:predicted HTH domain antitoxin
LNALFTECGEATQVTIDLPDEVGLDEHEAKERVVALLYEAGTLSEKQGCEVLGLSRRAFQNVLAEHDVAYMSSGPEDIQYELRHRRE